MPAVLIQLLTLKQLHFLQAIIKYAEKLCFCSSTYLNSKKDKNVGKSPNECWIMIRYHKRHQPDVIQIIFKLIYTYYLCSLCDLYMQKLYSMYNVHTIKFLNFSWIKIWWWYRRVELWKKNFLERIQVRLFCSGTIV